MDIEIINYVNATYGRQYPAQRIFEWATDVVATGRISQRNQLWSQPRRHWLINWSALNIEERNRLLEVFNRAAGQYRTFKLLESGSDGDYECSLSQCSITAIAGQVDFQLIKTYYSGETEEWAEDKKKIVPGTTFPPVIKVDGALKTEGVDYTLDDDTGIVTFGAAPGDGKIITANYRFYFQVRFAIDQYEDNRNIPDHWNYEGLHLIEDE
jgi:uncharacterized protein (TIGR02217 family)